MLGPLSDRRRELLRAKMEARHASTIVTDATTDRQGGEVVPLDRAS